MKPSEKYLKCEKSGTSLGCGTTAAAPTTAAPGFYKSVPRFDAHVDIDHLEQLCNDAEPADVYRRRPTAAAAAAAAAVGVRPPADKIRDDRYGHAPKLQSSRYGCRMDVMKEALRLERCMKTQGTAQYGKILSV